MNHALVINAGSSSIKYQLIDMTNEQAIAKGIAERIGIASSNLQHKPTGKTSVVIETKMKDHVQAMEVILEALLHPDHGVVTSLSEIKAVGHRIVHGGENFTHSVLLDSKVLAELKKNVDLAPLHNHAHIMGIKACQRVMPQTPMVLVFDTAFHQTMPPRAYMYGLPYDFYKRLKVRRYGFHGTSHYYVSRQAAKYMGRSVEELNIITCHLGNGSSIAAVKQGKVIDTSMGFTPLAGLMMGTRSGDIDPAIMEYVMKKDGLDIHQFMDILNKESGFLGISGFSSDMRDITKAMLEGNERANLVVDMLTYQIKKYIGAYAAGMDGLDCVVFTAGIGENMPNIRKDAVSGLDFLGIVYDENDAVKEPTVIHEVNTPASKVKVLVIPTNEELVIARETMALVGGMENGAK
jgi:acetate kinase